MRCISIISFDRNALLWQWFWYNEEREVNIRNMLFLSQSKPTCIAYLGCRNTWPRIFFSLLWDCVTLLEPYGVLEPYVVLDPIDFKPLSYCNQWEGLPQTQRLCLNADFLRGHYHWTGDLDQLLCCPHLTFNCRYQQVAVVCMTQKGKVKADVNGQIPTTKLIDTEQWPDEQPQTVAHNNIFILLQTFTLYWEDIHCNYLLSLVNCT